MPYLGNQSASANSKIKKYAFTATGSQTAFTVSSSPSDELQVFLNGVLLKETDDYTYTTSTVTLGSGATVSDIVEVHIYQSFILADAVASTGGAFTGDVKLEGNQLVLDADHDTTITADTDDQIDIKIAGTDKVTIDSTSLKVDVVGEKTSSAGVTIDGVLLKDSQVPASAGSSLVYLDKYTADDTDYFTYFNLGSYTSFNTYKILVKSLIPATDNVSYHFKIGTSTTAITSGYGGVSSKLDDTGSGVLTVNGITSNVMGYFDEIGSDSAEPGMSGEIMVYNPLSASIYTGSNHSTIITTYQGNVRLYWGGGWYKVATATPFLHFLTSSSSTNFESGELILYGVKDA